MLSFKNEFDKISYTIKFSITQFKIVQFKSGYSHVILNGFPDITLGSRKKDKVLFLVALEIRKSIFLLNPHPLELCGKRSFFIVLTLIVFGGGADLPRVFYYSK